MNQEVLRYEQTLKKKLRCTPTTRKRLLRQFHGFLITFLEEHPSPTEADLRDAFGPPEDMAKVLLESVGNAEIVRFDQLRKWKRIAAITLAALLLILMVYVFFWKEIPIYSYDSVVEGKTITTEGVIAE